ncbi:hypothetical protein [Nostoc sp.]|uniref:hypothetical protein n=1 Tax=Nostoc sp. TaxID=1180 RepID=UPI002FF7B483
MRLFLFLWDGHLVRPFWYGKMPTPQWNQGLTKLNCTRRYFLLSTRYSQPNHCFGE